HGRSSAPPQHEGAGGHRDPRRDEADLGAGYLAGRRPPHLADALDDVVHAVEIALRQVAAGGVDRDRPALVDGAAGGERAALALGAEPVVLELEEDRDG